MARNRLIILVLAAGWIVFSGPAAQAGDLRITIPKRSQSTPVQQLNRKGVDAVRRHAYDKARTLFYQAYLLDPDDPFTLNNLGFIAEVDGEVERAHRLYALASAQVTDAAVDHASSPEVEGETFRNAISGRQNLVIEINRANFDAIQLLSLQRALEAEDLLQRTLKLDPKNPFTLNNLGVAREAEGDFDGAQQYYLSAASLQSEEPVIVTLNGASRGKPVSQVAAENVKKLRERILTENSVETKVGRLNLQGVVAINRNDRKEAAEDFSKAYQIDPSNAFALNNFGYLSEMYGDLETAQIFYDRARSGDRSNARVGLATRSSAEGMKLADVAQESGQDTETRIQELQEVRRRQKAPILLRHRDNTPVIEPERPPQPAPDGSNSH